MTEHTTITEPGIYHGLPNEVYHAQHDWLSWSAMKNLIPPKTPAHFKAALSTPQAPKREFDLGHVTHALVLGEGDRFAVVQAMTKDGELYDATDYRTKFARDNAAELRAQGLTPLLRHELDAAQRVADAVHAHELAHRLLSDGTPEVSLFWVDPTTSVKCRARLDWLPSTGNTVVDFKTTSNAAPTEFAKDSAKFGYYGQQVHYCDGLRELGIITEPQFTFVAVEKSEPHLVSVGRLEDPIDMSLARGVVEHCRRTYASCMEADYWPGYGDGMNDLVLPMWLHYDMEAAGIAQRQEIVI